MDSEVPGIRRFNPDIPHPYPSQCLEKQKSSFIHQMVYLVKITYQEKLAWYMLVILVFRGQQVEQTESQNHKETDCPRELQKKKETVVSLFHSQCMTFFHTAPQCLVSQEGTTSPQSNKPVTGCLARDRAIDTLTNSDTSSSPANSFI